MPKISVNTQFDAGSIIVKKLDHANDLHFEIRKDTNSEFAQWFYFQLNGIKHQELKIHLDNLATTAYPDGWVEYNVCASYDNLNWFRVESLFAENSLSWSITPEANSIYFAYFEPYPYQRHQELIALTNSVSNTQHHVLGQTRERRNIDLLIIGDIAAKHKIWITARQHPGESMAEWFMEGLIHRLIDAQDAITNTLLQDCVFYLVPNMNPDGAIHGNLRTNSSGTNLNREWLTPSLENSPEVYYVRQQMLATGVTMFFDIHGDEALPYVFTSGCADNKSFSAKQEQLETKFEQLFQLINPDYQTEHGYPKNHFSVESATVATKWVGNQFDCLAFTLEMPFKDNANLPDLNTGWNGYRSYLLGQSLLTVINALKDTE